MATLEKETVPVPDSSGAPESARLGVAYGLSAYLAWGLAVLYFKAIARVPAEEILAHRIVWSVPLLLAWLAWRGRLGEIRPALKDRRTLLALLVSTALIATNWLLFIRAVSTGHVVQASLGYYITPLVNVLLGMVVLRERLRPAQWVSVLLAAAGVAYFALTLGSLPGVALVLAVSFALYGLLRKTVGVDGALGLAVETSLLLPVAAAFLLARGAEGKLVFGHDVPITTLLLAAGIVTSLPLLWFTNAVRRLRLATIGFLQYISPSIQLLLAVAVYGEPFTKTHLVTFACIWIALANYSADAWRRR